VRGADDVAAWAREVLWNAAGLALPFVAAAHRDAADLAAIDGRCDAAIPGHVAKRASRAQGVALLRAAEACFPAAAPIARAARAERLACHHAPIHGALLAALGADRDGLVVDYVEVADFDPRVLAAAVRLGLAGPLEAQGLQARLAPEAEEALRACDGIGVEDASAASPLVDVVQGHQDRLYSRLFQS
jgi:urease accessory protein